jgi:hypothetical protein
MLVSTIPAARLVVMVLLVVLAGGCGGETTTSTGTSPVTTASTTAAPTTPTVLPMTAEELAWLEAITRLHKKIDKAFSAQSVTLTPAKLRSWETVMRSCSRELARLGSPSERLEPVRALVQKACKQFDKGAACFAVAARNLNSGSTTVEQKLNCGTNAQGDGNNLLGEAEAKGEEIKLAATAPSETSGGNADEAAWVAGVVALGKKMRGPTESVTITAKYLREEAKRLGSCGAELAQLGPPTDRLQSVLVLAEQACNKYEEAAQCYTAAGSNIDQASKCIDAINEASQLFSTAQSIAEG